MSVLLFVVGAVAAVAGAVMVGFGIPINEFSFGNTLIAAGATTFMGGLVILGLGAVVAQLQRVVEALGTRPPLRAGRPTEPFEQPAARRAAASSRIPFPPKPKTEQRSATPQLDLQHETAPDDHGGESVAPTLHNPDEAPVAVEETDELPLSPRQPFAVNGSGSAEKRHEPFGAGWRAPPMPAARQPQNAFFDAMWPAAEPPRAKAPGSSEPRSEPKGEFRSEAKYEPKQDVNAETKYTPKYEPKSEPKYEFEPELKPEFKPEPQVAEPEPAPMRVEPEPGQPRPAGDVRAVAILKSGVVDGMGYTLYVDGSIEAELPQGTLRFASINELRSHLEKTS